MTSEVNAAEPRNPVPPSKAALAASFGGPWARRLAAVVLVAAGVAAYHNSFQLPFTLDDRPGIEENASLRQLWPLSIPLSPPAGSPLDSRPVANLTFALNYAVGGLEVWGYHLVNLVAHVLAGLVLFALVGRTLRRPSLPPGVQRAALGLAFAVALLWLVHPLQTDAVTAVVQRPEALMALCYLLTLYGLVRGAEAAWPAPWYVLAGLACLLGMGCKEAMVSAPVVALLYDRAFVAGSFREAWRRRAGLYVALGLTWGLLVFLVIASGGIRGHTAGFGQALTAWQYLRTQFGVVVHYLRLVFWPDPLVADYGDRVAGGVSEILPYALALAVLLAATVAGLIRNRPWGFLGAFFFAVLAGYVAQKRDPRGEK